jgi:response regulator of citrate/malate metabolism
LELRTKELEKKNGKEQKEIDELKKKSQKTEELEKRLKDLEKANHLLVEKISKRRN